MPLTHFIFPRYPAFEGKFVLHDFYRSLAVGGVCVLIEPYWIITTYSKQIPTWILVIEG